MTARRVAAILDNLPEGVSEIYLHPATCAYNGSVRGYRYSDEFAALMAPEVMTKARGAKLGRFGDFSGS
jgi:maltooligosyltrehalose synthase